MLIEYIERLRREPKEVRQRAVFTWTVVFVATTVFVYGVLKLHAIIPTQDDTSTLVAPYESTQ